MTRRKFQELRDAYLTDPVDRARVEEMGRASRLVVAIARLLDNACEAEHEPSGGSSDAVVPSIADADSEYLATLRDGIERLGGRLEVAAVFPDRRIPLLDNEAASPPSAQSSREE